MEYRELSVPGAWEITPKQFGDPRGVFLEWFKAGKFEEALGHPLDLQQANMSVSSAGVLRGIHFADTPPGQAKYVTCPKGAVLDVVVDIRVGSPTFGRWDAVLLDDQTHRTIYLSEGLAHGFLALQDDSTVSYLCSAGYSPGREHTICATDPAIGIEWPLVDGAAPTLSDRDAAAPSLAEVEAGGLLPSWHETREFTSRLR